MNTHAVRVQRALSLITIWSIFFSLGLQPVAAQPIQPTQVTTDIPCDTTPFGRHLALGKEQELFVSMKNTAAPQPQTLDWAVQDLNETNQLHTIAFADVGVTPNHISALAATAADLDGNGKSEFVQGFTDSSGQSQLVAHRNGQPDLTHTETVSNQSSRALAAGDILGQDNGAEQVVVASRGADNVLNVAVYSETVASGIGAPIAIWRSDTNGRGQGTKIHVAVGNLNNNRTADIVISLLQADGKTAQMITLEYQPNFQQGSGANLSQNLQERATGTYFVGAGTVGPKDLQMTLVDLSGSAQDRVVLAWDQAGGLGGLSPMLSLRTFDLLTINGTVQFVNREQWSTQSNSLSFALAGGDINGDHRDEIVVGYDAEGNSVNGLLNVIALDLINQNTSNPALDTLANWQDGNDGRNMTNSLALAVGDFNKDNRSEIAAAFQDANPFGYQLLHLTFNPTAVPVRLDLSNWGRQDASLDAPVGLTFGDWDNDSLRAVVRGKCAHVVDAHVTAADFMPPYWQNIQADQYRAGALGQAISQEDTVERSLTYHRADTVSAYVGVSAGVSFFDIAEFSASAKATGAQELAVSNANSTGTGTTTVVTAGQSWNEAAVVYEPAEYKCYSYQMSVDNTFIDTNDARLRFCQYQALPNVKPTLQASELDSWDVNYGDKPEYVPVLRDWASLALFRDNFTTQSSNLATAKLAVDSEIVHGSFLNGTIAQTNNEPQPWWQVDLGSVQDITKIRFWTPPTSLANFYLFVAPNPFTATEKPADLLARSDVTAYTLADLGNGWVMTDTAPSEATFVTLTAQHQPIQGRYVRVQRADTAVLSLAEVQVFGKNHVDPDRYPIDICDEGALNFYNDPQCTITHNDGYFMVKLYNPNHGPAEDAYVWKKVRGHVLWDGRRNAILNGKSVTRGNTSTEWSMSDGQVASKAQAETLDSSTSIGAEFEVEGGVGVKVQTGIGVERTTGIASEVVQSTSWSNEVSMSGQTFGFPRDYDGRENDWVLNCRYYFQPYTYDLTDSANLGYQHRYVALDYLVPDAGRDSDLNRTRDLAACRNGNLTGPTQTANDSAAAITAAPTTLSVLANDQGNDLLITAVGNPQHGAVTYTDRTITYTSTASFSGTDTFTYTVDSAVTAKLVTEAARNAPVTGVVTVTVGAAAPTNIIYLPLIAR